LGEDQPQPCALALSTRKLRDGPIRQIGATRQMHRLIYKGIVGR